MAKRNQPNKSYLELPSGGGGRRVPSPAPPPGRDPHLGKPAARFISGRWVGDLTSSERDPQTTVFKAKGKREISLEELLKEFESHQGFRVEITIFQDHDPDVVFRMSEALHGLQGTVAWNDPSVYVSRIRMELEEAYPTREYFVRLSAEEEVWWRESPEGSESAGSFWKVRSWACGS